VFTPHTEPMQAWQCIWWWNCRMWKEQEPGQQSSLQNASAWPNRETIVQPVFCALKSQPLPPKTHTHQSGHVCSAMQGAACREGLCISWEPVDPSKLPPGSDGHPPFRSKMSKILTCRKLEAMEQRLCKSLNCQSMCCVV
jgi:hypothetical protein